MRVLVVGGSGLVGTNVLEEARDRGYTAWGTYVHDGADEELLRVDKRNEHAVVELVDGVNPDVVVDTAAFHDVDSCERERETAFDVNARGTRNVAVAANRVGATYVYLSTDYVFPGTQREAPYTEDDPVAPCNYYAQTKYAGEQAAKIADQSVVLRPSVVYGSRGANFATWALSELRAGNEVDIVDDQISSPTYAPDLASACLDVLESDLTGVYNATGPENVSRYAFTVRLAEEYGVDTDLVRRISTVELGQTAPRPRNSSLDSSALYSQLGWTFSTPRSAFEEMAAENDLER